MRGKYVKGYFALSRLLVSDLLQRFILKFNKKVHQSLRVSDFGVLNLGSWVQGPGSHVPSPGSKVFILDYAVIFKVRQLLLSDCYLFFLQGFYH